MDTITSAGLDRIFAVFKDTTHHIKWTFRRATLEENTVLDYKKRRVRYDAGDIKWDSSKIAFPPLVEMTKFKPPQVQD